MNALVAILEHAIEEYATAFADYPKEQGCRECKGPIGCGGKWGLCLRHYKKHRRKLLKATMIEAFGGQCHGCGGVFTMAAYDFHHTGNKGDNPSRIMNDYSIQRVAEELSECALVCSNCHREIHSDAYI